MIAIESAKALLMLGERDPSNQQAINQQRAIAYALVDIAESLREIVFTVGHIADRTGR